MNKAQYKERSGYLRKLIHEISPPNRNSSAAVFIRGNFGACWHAQTQQFYIYNVYSENCIASVRYIGYPPVSRIRNLVIRYRPGSVYAEVLKGIKYGETIALAAPSEMLGRRSVTVRNHLHDNIRTAMMRERREAALRRRAQQRPRTRTAAEMVEQLMRSQMSGSRFISGVPRGFYTEYIQSIPNLEVRVDSSSPFGQEFGQEVQDVMNATVQARHQTVSEALSGVNSQVFPGEGYDEDDDEAYDDI